MQFLNIMGFLAAVAIPAVILLYLLKQQFEEVPVSSTYLWKQALTETEASKPWQKLRNNLLLILQLLILAALIFALARPFLLREGVGHETVIILDVSMSMQASDRNESRLEAAKDEINELINSMLPQDKMTLISAGKDAKMLLSRSDDKAALRKTLNDISSKNSSAAIDEAITIGKSLQREIEGVSILVFTDTVLAEEDGLQCINMAQNGDNVAVENVSYAIDKSSETLTVLARIHTYGESRVATVECELEGEVVDVHEVELVEDGTVNVYFKDLSVNASKIVVRIQEKDDLLADNEAYCYVQDQSETRILLVTDRNLFLEKALQLRSDAELNKASAEDAVNLSGYDLYVFDGQPVSEIAGDGAIWFINPPNDIPGYAVTESDGGRATKVSGTFAESFFAYVNLEELQFAKSKQFTALEADDLVPVATNGKNALMLAGERDGQRIFVTGFDFHDSNWPISKDFPIFVQNVLKWMIPEAIEGGQNLSPGDVVTVTPRATTERILLITPNEDEIDLAPPFPVKAFSETDTLGFYSVKQFDAENKETNSVFVVNPLVASESDLRTANTSSELNESLVKLSTNQEITYILILLALAIMMAEWWVYRRGH